MVLLKLQSSDGLIFTVDVKVAMMFTTLRSLLENLNPDGDIQNTEEILPIPNVKGRILEKIIEWATHHKDDPAPERTDNDQNVLRRTDDLSNWDKNFLRVNFFYILKLLQI